MQLSISEKLIRDFLGCFLSIIKLSMGRLSGLLGLRDVAAAVVVMVGAVMVGAVGADVADADEFDRWRNSLAVIGFGPGWRVSKASCDVSGIFLQLRCSFPLFLCFWFSFFLFSILVVYILINDVNI